MLRRRKTHGQPGKARSPHFEPREAARFDFLANVSHEMRTPLTSILGVVERALTSDPSVEHRQNYEVIKVAADTLMGLIEELLDLAKIRSGKHSLREGNYSLRDLLSCVMK